MVVDGVVLMDKTLAVEMVYNLASQQVVSTDFWMANMRVVVMVSNGVVAKEKHRWELPWVGQ